MDTRRLDLLPFYVVTESIGVDWDELPGFFYMLCHSGRPIVRLLCELEFLTKFIRISQARKN